MWKKRRRTRRPTAWCCRRTATGTRSTGEAVGRTAVTLTGRGKYVEFTTTQPANSLDLRYSIPDRADGSAYNATLSVYINGAKQRDLTLTNKYSWYYGAYPFVNTPSSGNPHHFYDEVHELLGEELPVGSRVRLQIDAEDSAASYTIDLADFEDVAPPRPEPAGAISVAAFGADGSGAHDSSSAFTSAVAAAAAQGKPVWIPAGTFVVTKHIVVPSNTTITGAGEWYSVVTGNGVGIYGNTAPNPSMDVHLSDFAIEGTIDVRDDAAQVNGIGGAMGGGSTISDLWIEHTKVGIWFDGPFDGLTIDHTRIDDTTADGINLHDGVTNATVTDNFIRNTGDDGIAAWSENDADTDDVISFDTVEVPVLANNIAIYGGADNQVTDDVVSDTQTQGGGIHLANRFNAVAMSGTTTIARDTALRTGVLDPNWKYGVGALWFWASDSPMAGAVRVNDVDLIDSSYEGVQFTGSSVTNVDLTNVAIAGAGTFALQLESHGSASFKNVVATNIGASAGTYNCLYTGSSDQAFVVTNQGGNTGWSTTFCGALADAGAHVRVRARNGACCLRREPSVNLGMAAAGWIGHRRRRHLGHDGSDAAAALNSHRRARRCHGELQCRLVVGGWHSGHDALSSVNRRGWQLPHYRSRNGRNRLDIGGLHIDRRGRRFRLAFRRQAKPDVRHAKRGDAEQCPSRARQEHGGNKSRADVDCDDG